MGRFFCIAQMCDSGTMKASNKLTLIRKDVIADIFRTVMHNFKLIQITSLALAASLALSGCATSVVAERKAAAEKAASDAALAAQATPAPTPEPTPEPINAWSLLDHLPDFQLGVLENPGLTWADGIPLGQNPLEYEGGDRVTGLSIGAQDISVNPDDVQNLQVGRVLVLAEDEQGNSTLDSVRETPTGEGVEKSLADAAVATKNEGSTAMYHPIGSSNGNYTAMMNATIAKENGLTLGEAFRNGYYYSATQPTFLDGFPEDGSPEEQFSFLYETYGNPSGLFWRNNASTQFTPGKQYDNFDAFKSAKYSPDYGAKEFCLVWNFDGFKVLASCYDQFDSNEVEGTRIQNIILMPGLQNEDYIIDDDGTLIWGYQGYGEAPIQLTGKVTKVEPIATPVPEAPAEETPVEQAPVEESPVEETAPETPVEETPVEEPPAEE